VDRNLGRLRAVLGGTGGATLILCDNAGQLERLDELLHEGDSGAAAAMLAVGALDGGFVMPTLRVLTDHEIFRRARRLRRARRYRQAAPSLATGALTAGDYVVHLDHGIGIYRGIQMIMAGEATIEAAVVEYEGGDRLNVPLYRLDQLERYRAAGEDGEQAPETVWTSGLEVVVGAAEVAGSAPSTGPSVRAARTRRAIEVRVFRAFLAPMVLTGSLQDAGRAKAVTKLPI